MNHHPGFSESYVIWLLGDLYTNKASIELECSLTGYGLKWFDRTRDLRESVNVPGDDEYKLWLMYADGNRCAALMALGRVKEALPLLEEIVTSETQGDGHDVYLTSYCDCLILLQRFDDAKSVCDKAIAISLELYGPESIKVAL